MRYVGSKNKIAKHLAPIIQSYIDKNNIKKYLEPFVGGANMIDKIKCEKKIGCDIHEELIELLKAVQNNIDLPDRILESEYYEVKNNKEKYPKWYVGLVGFCASFGAKYFGGYARDSKDDNSGKWSAGAINNLKKQIPNLKDVHFFYKNFLDIPKDKLNKYVIYCDPPYKNTTEYKTEKFPYEEFYQWCRDVSKNNIVLISEYSMPEDFECIWQMECKTLIDSNKKRQDKDNVRIEKLFTYKLK